MEVCFWMRGGKGRGGGSTVVEVIFCVLHGETG